MVKYLRNFVCLLVASIYCTGSLSQPISVVECPKTSGYQLVLLPDPQDCSKFFMCGVYGQYTHMNCPPGLYFNPKLDVCDYPENVDCTPLPTGISSTTTTTTKTTTTNIPHYNMSTTAFPNSNMTSTTFTQNNITTTEPQSNVTIGTTHSTVPNLSTDQILNNTVNSSQQAVHVKSHGLPSTPKCPANSGSELVILPDPYDCSSYYMCTAAGTPIHMECPVGLFFNPTLQVCDYPQYINCIPLVTTTPTPLQNVTTPEHSTYQPINNTSSYAPEKTTPEYSTYQPSNYTTTHISGNMTFAPISNTTSAIPDISTTLPQYNTTLVVSETSTPSITAGNYTSTTASPIINSTAPANTTSSPGNSSNTTGSPNFSITAPPAIASQCPSFSPSVLPTHLANPEDCTSFYTCVADNTAFLQFCQTGLMFNAPMQMCDFPHNVEC